MDLARFSELSKNRSSENKKFLHTLKKKDPRKVDDAFHTQHEEVFEEINCLDCANCCKTTSPIFYQNDIERLAKSLRMKPGDFIEKYLTVDQDKDYVLTTAPCPFLGTDNYVRCMKIVPKRVANTRIPIAKKWSRSWT